MLRSSRSRRSSPARWTICPLATWIRAARRSTRWPRMANRGVRAPALLVQAGIAQQKGDKAGAIKLYEQVTADTNAPQPYRDLASIRLVAANFDAMKPEDVIAKLKPLAVPGNPWFGSAGELVGIAYLKQGKTELAGPLFAAIAKSKDTPETLQTRARQMAGLLGVDAVDEAAVTLTKAPQAAATAAE